MRTIRRNILTRAKFTFHETDYLSQSVFWTQKAYRITLSQMSPIKTFMMTQLRNQLIKLGPINISGPFGLNSQCMKKEKKQSISSMIIM